MIVCGSRQTRYRILNILRLHWRRMVFNLALAYILFLYNEQKHPLLSKPHMITQNDIDFANTRSSTPLLTISEAQSLCSAQRWDAYPQQVPSRRVYDLFMLNDELDWLEIRLSTLFHYVDYFIILESPITFTRHPKPLIFEANKDRFAAWQDKIIHKVLEDPLINATRTWDIEDFQRNGLLLQGLKSADELEGKGARKGDVLIISDVDEIPRPATLLILRNCQTPKRVTVRSRFYYYGFQFLHVGEEWAHPQATTFEGWGYGQTILPADLRNGEGGNILRTWWEKADLWNAGWHCSTCFETVEEVLGKMASFSHTSLNREEFRGKKRIVDRVSKGLDLWDRKGEVYEKITANEDVPDYLKSDRERWKYLLDRTGSNGGFKDYDESKDPLGG